MFSPEVLRFAVIGHPIAHSRSPQIHQAFAEQCGISLEYRRIDIAPPDLAAQLAAFFAHGGAGLNVTLPHKSAAASLCTGLSERAIRAGAVNTLSRDEEGARFFGDNTDGIGLVRDLSRILAQEGQDLREQRILILGSGGAARGAIAGLHEASVSALFVMARDTAKAQLLAEQIGRDKVHLLRPDTAQTFDIVINATSAALSNVSPSIGASLSAAPWLAYDLGYAKDAKQSTPFVRESLERGSKVAVDGLGMLVEQAAESFFVWHKVRPDASLVLMRLREGQL